ncbi:hypothetical protein AALA82_12995 [Oscillospiraceae bacterium 50-16]|nr:hypothetical protein [Lawsonibacter sp.]
MKSRRSYQIALSIIAVVLSVLSSSFGYSFLGGMPWPFHIRFFAGLLLMMSPMVVSWLVFELFRKEKRPAGTEMD